MKHIKIITLASLLAIHFQAAAEIRVLNGVATEVNASIITYGDIERTVRLLRSNPASASISNEELAKTAKQQLMERALLVYAAKEQGLKVTSAEIDAELNRRATAAHTTVENLFNQTKKLGWSRDAYRLEVAKDLLVERMIDSMNESVKVSDNDIQAYINQAQKDGQVVPSGNPYTVYNVRRIVLKINENNKAAAVGDRMKLIAKSVQSGSDFGTLAKRYSQEAAAAQNGVVELPENSQPEKVEAMLQLLKVGETSAPIQTTQNWQMLQMLGKRTEIDPTKTQREAIRRLLVRKEQQKQQTQFMQQLMHDAVVNNF